MKSANALVAHGGGPTAVLNASLAGLVQGYGDGTMFAARGGLAGLVRDDMIDLTSVDSVKWQGIGRAPGSVIGTSRYRLDELDYDRVLDKLRRRDIHRFFYTGGNGSMGTALAIEKHALSRAYELQVIGIPKTLDNDLMITDHTPGYASTARFFACAARDAGEDNRALPSPICVLEVLGRNAGWVVAATALARDYEDDAPHLIYFPERCLSLDRIAADVEKVYRRLGRVFVTVCEGQRDEHGVTFGADVDRANDPAYSLASNLGHTLARLLATKLGIRARAERPGLVGRSCGLFASAIDREEAYRCGQEAATAAARGESGKMVAIRRESNAPYRSSLFLTPLTEVAGKERVLPAEFIVPGGNDVTPEFLEWASPLAGPIDPWVRL